VLATAARPVGAAADAGVEFFEQKVRPVLVDTCYKCHSASADKVKGGLLLDTRDGLLKGGDSGAAIAPGDPEKSLLIKAVRYTDENLQMPPKNKKLSAEQISALEQWVKMGAPDPRTNASVFAATWSVDQAKKHWAFQPVRSPEPPKVKETKWIGSPIDNFVLAKLKAKGLTPSSRADKRTLIRRATYDLTGLPPTAEEVEAFVADKSPDPFAKVIDRLLASPRYGERWARYWLDIARYADTKGYVFEEERRYPFAYTYRDYVIRSFNEDLPFDQFVVQQLAADQLDLGEDKRPLAALGFLTLGRRFLNNQPDIIDDRIDTMSRGLMGLTVSCARCHDHKFDPVTTKDYYSLYGVFASSEEPNDKPLLGTNALPAQYPEYLAERKKREDDLAKFLAEKETELLTKMRGQVGDYLLAAHDSKKLKEEGKQESIVRERKLSPRVARRWMERLENTTTNEPVFGAWIQFASLAPTNFAEMAKTIAVSNSNPLIAAAFTNAPASLKEVAERYGKVFAALDKQWRETSAKTNAPASLSDTNAESLRQVLYADASPFKLAREEMTRLFDTPSQQKQRALKRKVDELDATHAGAPPRAMALLDKSSPVEPVVFIRGNPGNRGAAVKRQFLEVLSHGKPEPFKKGSGRLELAQQIASTDNPLTARVLVNRIWMYHFGAPLVRTPSDFGTRSDPPTHPELLDFLAARFMADGWSLKKLHRLMMLSSTYQQSSEHDEAKAKIDPANELFWRANRRRLDFEAMRDSLLVASDRLDLTMGGHAVDITTQPFATRRSVYAFIERQNLPGLFRTFDFASPDTSSSQRFATTVPQQALFLMNSPFVIEQAKKLAERAETKGATEEARIERLYRIACQRAPQRDELSMAKQFVSAQLSITNRDEPKTGWQYGFGEYNAEARRVKSFSPLPHFTGTAWQGSAKLPDDKLGWAMLTADGGHVGNDLQHAAVRRWTAPADGTMKVRGRLDHASKEGDGVRGRIVSSRSGLLGEWTVHNTNATVNVDSIEVKRGDTIDFVVDMRGGYGFDSFTWSPRVAYTTSLAGGARGEWKAKEDFAGPQAKTQPLTRWQELAQVLLLSNEFMFVD
jgi:hypothetical protein